MHKGWSQFNLLFLSWPATQFSDNYVLFFNTPPVVVVESFLSFSLFIYLAAAATTWNWILRDALSAGVIANFRLAFPQKRAALPFLGIFISPAPLHFTTRREVWYVIGKVMRGYWKWDGGNRSKRDEKWKSLLYDKCKKTSFMRKELKYHL